MPIAPTNLATQPKPLKPAVPLGGPNAGGGLVASNMGGGSATPAASASVTGYQPVTRTVDAPTQTVAGQVNKIVGEDSPLLQLERTKAKQAYNARGLVNSSMGVQAGEMATLNAALPIAQSDAGIYNDTENRNMDTINRASEFNVGAGNTEALQRLAGEQNLTQIGAQGEQQRLNIGAQGAQNLTEIGAQGTQQRLTAAQTAQAQSRLQAEQGEIQKQLQTADAATKERLLVRSGEIEREQQILRGGQATELQTLQGQQQTALQTLQGQQTTALETQRGQIQQQLLTAEGAQKTALMEQQARIERDLTAQKILAETNLQELRGTQALAEQGLRGTQALAVAQVEATYKGLMQANDSAARSFTQISAAITEILINPNMDQTQKQSQVDKQVQLLEVAMAVYGGAAGVDLVGLLDFT